MASYPHDQFDDLPDDLQRVGAHRGPATKGRGWITFAWAALATGILVAVGLFALAQVDHNIQFSLPGSTAASTPTPTVTPTPTPTITPITDPTTITSRGITITVLNGTTLVGLATKATAELTSKKWTVGSTADASVNTEKQTVVYYSLAANEDVAKGVALALGVTATQLTTNFPGAPITVVLGTDYKG